MKKMKWLLAGLCGAFALLPSCTEDELIQENIQNGNKILMSANDFKFDKVTRTSFDINENGAAFSWADNDTVGIFPMDGGQVYFPMVGGAGTKSAVFTGEGWGLKSAAKYAAYYPYNFYNRDASNIVVDYSGQVQMGNGSTAHLGKYDYMATVATTPENGNVNFEFQHLGCMVAVELPVTQPGKYYRMIVSNEYGGGPFNRQGKIDLTSDSLHIVPFVQNTWDSRYLNIGLQDIHVDRDTVLKIYFMMMPHNFNGKKLTVDLSSTNGQKSYEFYGRNFEAGKAYLLSDTPHFDVVNVEKAGTLATLIPENLKNSTVGLKVKGQLNSDDICFIREMCGRNFNDQYVKEGQLTHLDLSEVTFKVGGKGYKQHWSGTTLTTEENVIGEGMFAQTNLLWIKLPKNTTTVGNSAFSNTGLKTIAFPNSVKIIEDYAYMGNRANSVTLPPHVEVLGHDAFAYSNFKTVYIPETVKSISEGVFSGCPFVTVSGKYTFDNRYICDGDLLIAYAGGATHTSFTVPAGVKRLGTRSLANCGYLTHLVLPQGLEQIGFAAISEVENLSSITIPESVTQIEGGNFWGCNKIESFYGKYTADNHRTLIYENILMKYAAASTDSSYIFADNIAEMEQAAFADACNLQTVVIPETCGLTAIPYNTFNGCENLKSVEISSKVTRIFGSTFTDCTRLKTIICHNPEPAVVDNDIFGWGDPQRDPDLKQLVIYVPAESVEKYKAAEYWNQLNVQPILTK